MNRVQPRKVRETGNNKIFSIKKRYKKLRRRIEESKVYDCSTTVAQEQA